MFIHNHITYTQTPKTQRLFEEIIPSVALANTSWPRSLRRLQPHLSDPTDTDNVLRDGRGVIEELYSCARKVEKYPWNRGRKGVDIGLVLGYMLILSSKATPGVNTDIYEMQSHGTDSWPTERDSLECLVVSHGHDEVIGMMIRNPAVGVRITWCRTFLLAFERTRLELLASIGHRPGLAGSARPRRTLS